MIRALVQRTNELNKATTVESSGYNANNELITVSSKGVDKDVYREGNRQANAVASAQNGSATVMAMSDISVPSATNTSKGIKVTICARGIQAGDNVYVLHKLKSGSWQTVKPDSVSNGKVTVTLYSFSPVIVVRYSSNVNPTVTTDPSKDENSRDQIQIPMIMTIPTAAARQTTTTRTTHRPIISIIRLV